MSITVSHVRAVRVDGKIVAEQSNNLITVGKRTVRLASTDDAQYLMDGVEQAILDLVGEDA